MSKWSSVCLFITNKKEKNIQSVIFLNSRWAVGFTSKKDYWKALPTVCTSVHQKNLIQGKLRL